MRLKNVKVHQNGNKGMTVTYLKTEVRDGIPYEDEFRRRIMTPVPNEIRYVLQKLGKHLGILSYLNMGTETNDSITAEQVNVVEVISDESNYYQLVGNVCGKYGRNELKSVMISTEDGLYKDTAKVLVLIRELYEKSVLFVRKEMTQTTKQMLMNFSTDEKLAKNFEGVNIEEMSEAEQKEMAKKILAKTGAIVLDPEEYGVDVSEGEEDDEQDKELGDEEISVTLPPVEKIEKKQPNMRKVG